jgi:hypothetical protein
MNPALPVTNALGKASLCDGDGRLHALAPARDLALEGMGGAGEDGADTCQSSASERSP